MGINNRVERSKSPFLPHDNRFFVIVIESLFRISHNHSSIKRCVELLCGHPTTEIIKSVTAFGELDIPFLTDNFTACLLVSLPFEDCGHKFSTDFRYARIRTLVPAGHKLAHRVHPDINFITSMMPVTVGRRNRISPDSEELLI